MPEFCYEVNFLQFDFTGKRCAVLGLGISNLPLIDFLLDHGALVSARDQKSVDETDPRIAAWRARGVEFVTGDGYLDDIRADYVFRSPGIRPDLDGIAAAVQNGAVLTSEMELFFALCPAKIFAVTGSDGKTTTTTLTYKLPRRDAGSACLSAATSARPCSPASPRCARTTMPWWSCQVFSS